MTADLVKAIRRRWKIHGNVGTLKTFEILLTKVSEEDRCSLINSGFFTEELADELVLLLDRGGTIHRLGRDNNRNA